MKKFLYVFAVASVLAAVLFGGFGVQSVQAVDSCPNSGGWVKVDSDDLSQYPVAGATNYCFKFGSVNSQGCTGGVSSNWPPPGVANPCGLSHWSYFIPEAEDPTATPTNTEVPTFTPTLIETITATVTEMFTNTPEWTPTNPEDPTVTPTNPNDPTGTPGDPCVDHPEQCPSVTPEVTVTGTPGGKSDCAFYYEQLPKIDWSQPLPDGFVKAREGCNKLPKGAGINVGFIVTALLSVVTLVALGARAFKRKRA